jgi:hypothetical protein
MTSSPVVPRRLQQLLGDLRRGYALAFPYGRELADILQPPAQGFADAEGKGLGLPSFRQVQRLNLCMSYMQSVGHLKQIGS